MNTFIQPLSSADLHPFWLVFEKIINEEFPGYTPETKQYFLEKMYSEEHFKYYLDNHMKDIYIAKEGDAIVGFAVIDEPYGGVSVLRWLGVLKTYQKMGLGKRLVDSWIALAKGCCHKVEVAAQASAKEFYAKCGLELEGHKRQSYFGIDQYMFGRILKETGD